MNGPTARTGVTELTDVITKVAGATGAASIVNDATSEVN